MVAIFIQNSEKKMKTNLKFLLFVSLIVAGCTGLTPLSIERQHVINNGIRYNGFYYNEPDLAHIFFYENGIIYTWSGGPGYLLDDFDKYYSNPENYKTSYDIPYCWGVFNISSQRIEIEEWVSSDAFAPYKTAKFSGLIINDTTLLINHPAEMIGTDTFYFKKFSFKPDSKNKFIK